MRRLFLAGGGKAPYWRRVLRTRPGSLIGYWPLWETGGAVGADVSGNGRHGAYTGVDLGQPGAGDGRTAPLFDGANDYCSVYSVALRDAFNASEGTATAWARVANAGVWTDATTRRILSLYVNTSNQIYLYKSATAGRLGCAYFAGGVSTGPVLDGFTATGWFHLAFTWSKSGDVVAGYLNGVAFDPKSGLGAWTGSLAAIGTNIGANLTTPTNVWSGWLAHVAMWSAALRPAEISALARMR